MPQDNPTSDRFGKMFVIGAIGGIVTIAGLIAALAMTAEGVNQSREDLVEARPERTTVAVPLQKTSRPRPLAPAHA